MNYAVLSFFHNCFLLLSLHFCIKSTIKIVVVVVVAFLKPAILCSKPPLALRSGLDLVFSRTRFLVKRDHHLLF